jgi:hypothetical protein
MHNGGHEEDGFEKGGCKRLVCVAEWHYGKPSNPCKRGNTDVKTMMMMMMISGSGLLDSVFTDPDPASSHIKAWPITS